MLEKQSFQFSLEKVVAFKDPNVADVDINTRNSNIKVIPDPNRPMSHLEPLSYFKPSALAGPHTSLGGPQTPLTDPQTPPASPQTPPAGPQTPPAGLQTLLAGPQTTLASPQTPLGH